MAPRGGSCAGAMPAMMQDSLTEYEMDREERLAKNRAVLAALSIPSLAAETRETPDETGDGSRRRGRAGASASSAPSRRSSRAEARKVKTYADAAGEDSGDRVSDDIHAGSDSARARTEEEADADFSGSESESESESTRSETGVSEEDDDDDARIARAHSDDTPEIIELDEDGKEVGGEAEGEGRATDLSGRRRKRERTRDEPPTRIPAPAATTGRRAPGTFARKARNDRDAVDLSPALVSNDDANAGRPTRNRERKGRERAKEKRERSGDETRDAAADARDAFLAFLAPSASVAVRRGFLELSDATFGLRELRAVVNAHGFEDWTDEELAHMLAPEVVRPPEPAAEQARGRDVLSAGGVDAGAEGTDPSAADAARRAEAAAAAAKMRLGVSDLARLAETVGARRRAT